MYPKELNLKFKSNKQKYYSRLLNKLIDPITSAKFYWSTLGSSIKYVRKIFRKTISNPLIRTRTCAYQGVRNVNFAENFAYVLNG